MPEMLVGVSEIQFEEFLRQGGQPAVVLTTTPLQDRRGVRGSDILVLDFFKEMYYVPENCFEKRIDSQLLNEVWDNSHELYIRTHFRHEKKRTSYSGSWLDVNNHFYSLAQKYWKLIKEHGIDCVIFDDVPHLGGAIIIYYLSKALGITTLVCWHGIFRDTFLISQDIETIGLDPIGNDLDKPSIKLEDRPSYPVYMPKKLGMSRHRFLKDYIYHALSIILKTITLSFFWNKASLDKSKRKLTRHLEAYSIQNFTSSSYSRFDPNADFIYFPLHLQPEMTTDVLGGRYCDQILAIEEMARQLPEGMVIYVKENPKQTAYMRDPSFFKRLFAIPAVRYLPIEVPTLELIAKSRAVATVTGTAGWEALQMGKPVLCFGFAWYRAFPGVYQWDGSTQPMERALNFTFDKGAFERSFKVLSRHFWPGDVSYIEYDETYTESYAAKRRAASILTYMRLMRSAKPEGPRSSVAAETLAP